jgi:hypothetical protein
LTNVNATFLHNDPASNIANRLFLASGANTIVPPNGTITFYYSNTGAQSFWRQLT